MVERLAELILRLEPVDDRTLGNGLVQFIQELFDIDIVNAGPMLDGLEGGNLALHAFKAEALKNGDGLRVAENDVFDGHVAGNHVSLHVSQGDSERPNFSSRAILTTGGTKVSIGPRKEATSLTIDELR